MSKYCKNHPLDYLQGNAAPLELNHSTILNVIVSLAIVAHDFSSTFLKRYSNDTGLQWYSDWWMLLRIRNRYIEFMSKRGLLRNNNTVLQSLQLPNGHNWTKMWKWERFFDLHTIKYTLRRLITEIDIRVKTNSRRFEFTGLIFAALTKKIMKFY